MKNDDKRVIWKHESDLKLMQVIWEFIEKHQIDSVRKYQLKLKEYPKEVPSLWFIKERFGSWDKLLIQLGENSLERYCWAKMPNDDLQEIVVAFIKEEKICSQRAYERRTVGNKTIPSLDTLKKRFDDIKPFFKRETEGLVSDFELLFELRNEIIRLGLEESLSMNEFRNRVKSENLPSVDTIMRKTGKTWEELMEEIGFDYREIKIEKLIRNFQ